MKIMKERKMRLRIALCALFLIIAGGSCAAKEVETSSSSPPG
jgi:hypothetical protein